MTDLSMDNKFIIFTGLLQVALGDHYLDSDILSLCFAYKGECCAAIMFWYPKLTLILLKVHSNCFLFPLIVYFIDKRIELSDVSSCRAGGDASEEALDRLPTSATCMNLLKLPPYRRFALVLAWFCSACMEFCFYALLL